MKHRTTNLTSGTPEGRGANDGLASVEPAPRHNLREKRLERAIEDAMDELGFGYDGEPSDSPANRAFAVLWAASTGDYE